MLRARRFVRGARKVAPAGARHCGRGGGGVFHGEASGQAGAAALRNSALACAHARAHQQVGQLPSSKVGAQGQYTSLTLLAREADRAVSLLEALLGEMKADKPLRDMSSAVPTAALWNTHLHKFCKVVAGAPCSVPCGARSASSRRVSRAAAPRAACRCRGVCANNEGLTRLASCSVCVCV